MQVRSYGKIHQVGHRAVLDILNHHVVCEEKVDGSQFSFGVYEGHLLCRSKGVQIDPHDTTGLFAKAVRTANELADAGLLTDGWTYRAEYLAKPKHNTLCYARTPARHLILFDVDRGMEDYLSPDDKSAEADRIGLEYVPMFASGKVDLEAIKSWLDRDSVLGGQKVEGVVIKAYGHYGADGKLLAGKLVSEDFKERHEKDWKQRHVSGSDIKYDIASALRTDAVWEKAVQHARDRGELEGTPRDIGLLMRELNTDIEAEQRDFIKDRLYEWARKDILRMATRGFPEWYKRRLVEQVEQPAEHAPSS